MGERPQEGSVKTYSRTSKTTNRINSVCENINCPRISACFKQGIALFHILGNYCSRECKICGARTFQATPVNPDEPLKIARRVKSLKLQHVALTSSVRDDLPDNGSEQLSKTVIAIHEMCPDTVVEVIIHHCIPPNLDHIKTIVASSPDIIAHHIMSIPRLHENLFDGANYDYSMNLLEKVKSLNPGIATKSGMVLGLGEYDYEVVSVMNDLREVGCNCLTLGQYTPRSNNNHHAIPYRRVSSEEFAEYQSLSMQMGYSSARCGPFFCSLVDASEMYKEIAE